MRAVPLVVNFHNENAPIYSVHFEQHGKGRLATAGGDNNVRLWKLEANGEERQVTYLTTLIKHTQAVNVVRFCPRGEMLASAGDDGNVLLWVPSELRSVTPALGEDGQEDKETWRIKHMCRSSGSEIYDLAWSPDGVYFITGSMDNIARIYNAHNGQIVRLIAEHNHYVQGVAWDPLNEFVATQSSDRSVHIYSLKTKDGQFTLNQHGKISKMDLPSRRISSNSPAPPEFGPRQSHFADTSSLAVASPIPSAPGTPTSLPLPMNPPALTPSRRSSFSSSPSMRRSVSPAPSLPLPAVKPMESSPKLHHSTAIRNANIYANESLTSFFRRLTFTPDGSLLFTPAGQYKVSQPSASDGAKTADDVINTVYIYTRAGFHKPPIAHLPGHKKPSIAVRCSPILYTLRKGSQPTKHITVDTASGEDSLSSLPEPAVPSKPPTSTSTMDPPPSESTSQTPATDSSQASGAKAEAESGSAAAGPAPAFALPYRIIYAVATQDAVLIYDTQQQTPLCVVSNLHYATFTDLTWSMDGLSLIMSSSDGFCSAVTFAPGELGQVYNHIVVPSSNLAILPSASSSNQSTPAPTPVSAHPHPFSRQTSNPTIASLSPLPARPSSPARSNSTSSATTHTTQPPGPPAATSTTPTPSGVSGVSGTTAPPPSAAGTGSLPLTTPPQTPMVAAGTPSTSTSASNTLGKRESAIASESEREQSETSAPKRRKIEPTPVEKVDKPSEGN